MTPTVLAYSGVLLLSVLISAISQVMLKKSAMRKHTAAVTEYLNPLVIFAYTLFVAATLLSVIAYRGIPLSMGPILDATGYIYVTAFGVLIFHEKLNARRVLALALIIAGIVIYSLSV